MRFSPRAGSRWSRTRRYQSVVTLIQRRRRTSKFVVRIVSLIDRLMVTLKMVQCWRRRSPQCGRTPELEATVQRRGDSPKNVVALFDVLIAGLVQLGRGDPGGCAMVGRRVEMVASR